MEIAKHAVSAASRRTGGSGRRAARVRIDESRSRDSGFAARGGAREGARDERARRPASHRAGSTRCDAVRQMRNRMGGASGKNSRTAATLLRAIGRPHAERFARGAATCACALRQGGSFAAHAAGSTAFAAPRCLNEVRCKVFLYAATKLSQHAIIVVVRNDNGNHTHPTTKKCRMSSDRNSARLSRISPMRFDP
ncbi:hypothetical protein [Burkholderia thailandensis]|uniref:hypothetical protein n=1 Tax=Burkholderia thailandensis TaxID=57975 RepID=UPI002D76CCE1|nr:hypothetical protein [Burkholderia thailandensis]WRS65998.1 hypothetical protein U9S59_01210 [Burkholderia thailandensis]